MNTPTKNLDLWTEVQCFRPKAIAKFDEHFGIVRNEKGNISAMSKHQFHLRDLYDFFDEQQIIIQIQYKHRDGFTFMISYTTKKMNPYKRFTFDTHAGGYIFKREKIEEIAYKKAFEILETKL